MEAGKELDTLVAEKVMGWQLDGEPYTRWTLPDGTEQVYTPLFSFDISAAWQVVEQIERTGLYVEVGLCNAQHGPKTRAWCEIAEYGEGGSIHGVAYEDTAPLAICMAALKTKGYPPVSADESKEY